MTNTGDKPTYVSTSLGHESIVDVTFCSPSLISNTDWRVTDEYIDSDHKIIRFKVELNNKSKTKMSGKSIGVRWKIKELNKDFLCDAFELSTKNKSDLSPAELTRITKESCDIAMPRRSSPKYERKAAYWFNP